MTDPDTPNEILADAKAAKDRRKAAKPQVRRSWPLGRIGIGVGIGSAAIAAAVLFANRRKGDA